MRTQTEKKAQNSLALISTGTKVSRLFEEAEDGRAWTSILADIMMLIIVFFVFYFTMLEVDKNRTQQPEAISSVNAATAGQPGIMPAGSGLLPSVQEALGGEDMQGITVSDVGYNRLLIRLEDGAHFASGSISLSEKMQKTLDNLLPILKQRKSLEIAIHGHTDNLPIREVRFQNNWELSVLRATETLRYLLKSGIDGSRLSASGYGDSAPIADNGTESGRSENRRIEIFLTDTATNPLYINQ